ncbi:cGMP-specific 3',5'-cyclic phosphodiesterase [Takifugu flavidus]|uniref:cGMP-specific 3',5'-cyclic phosphodiesterase n=1 Tax=Takifugu flavidus TaxID=433684 RepID=A0A5C6NE19_9TELE|nr:cGMP-specific 3',5'-cyclic phosphodiesterase [Takifugu flavidus]
MTTDCSLSAFSCYDDVVCLCRDCDVSQINYMYAQYVKNTMQTLNIADVTKDQRFPWTGENPDHTNDQIKSLLCTPIRNGKKDKVIGKSFGLDALQR